MSPNTIVTSIYRTTESGKALTGLVLKPANEDQSIVAWNDHGGRSRGLEWNDELIPVA